MKRGQKGFTVVETLLVLILIAIIGFTGYYVYHTKNNANTTYNNAANTSKSSSNTPNIYEGWNTYTGNSFSFKYPKGWKATDIDAPPSAPSVKAVEVKPANDTAQGLIFYGPPTTSTSNAKEEATQVFSNDGSRVVSSNENSINGYDTYTAQTMQTAGGTTYSFWNTYIVHDGKLIYCNYPATSPNVSTDKQIVGSLKLL